ncbi:hypothetical protein D3C72_1439150 [compost metagenome]
MRARLDQFHYGGSYRASVNGASQTFLPTGIELVQEILGFMSRCGGDSHTEASEFNQPRTLVSGDVHLRRKLQRLGENIQQRPQQTWTLGFVLPPKVCYFQPLADDRRLDGDRSVHQILRRDCRRYAIQHDRALHADNTFVGIRVQLALGKAASGCQYAHGILSCCGQVRDVLQAHYRAHTSRNE